MSEYTHWALEALDACRGGESDKRERRVLHIQKRFAIFRLVMRIDEMNHFNYDKGCKSYIDKLAEILTGAKKTFLFICIEDLVKNGPDMSRFSGDESKLSRVDVTEFLAFWFKYAGVTPDECRQWLIDYCANVLSSISSSSKSRITHSTKSIIKYVFNTHGNFDCGCEKNRFKLSCTRLCPDYEKMQQLAREKEARMATVSYEVTMEDRRKWQEKIHIEPIPSKREQFREQFEKAIDFLMEKSKEGVSIHDLVSQLNKRGFKTSLGNTWTYGSLRNVLKKHNMIISRKKSEPGQVKIKYAEQFERAWRIVLEKRKKGISRQSIIAYLNENGYKTRTGRRWTYPILGLELKRNSRQ